LRKIWSRNPLVRVNEKIRRHTNFVGVLPNDDAVLRLAGSIHAKQHNEWQTSDCCYFTINNFAVSKMYQPNTFKVEDA
jgi:putative transposase